MTRRHLRAFVLLLFTAFAAPLLAQGSERPLGVHRDGDRLALDLTPGAELRRLALYEAGLRQSLPKGTRTVPLAEGCSLLVADLDATSVKVLTCRDAADPAAALGARLRAGETAFAKVGSPVELRAYANPALLRPGADLPLRAYLDQAPRAGAAIEALGPGGDVATVRTDASGFATVRITASGPWTVRTRAGERTAELRFEVEGAAFWDALPKPDWTRPAVGKRKASSEWRELGPAPLAQVGNLGGRNTGRAATVVAVEGRRNRYYVGGASGGVWESLDGGRSWTALGENLPTLAVGAVAVDPSNDQTIYVGSGEGNQAYHSLYGRGLYRTTDRGRTWQVLADDVFAGRSFTRLVVSPFDSRELWAAVTRAGGTFAGTEGARQHPHRAGAVGLFRSRDRGETWEHLRAPQGLPAIMATDVDLDPRDRNRVYASFGDSFARARNGVYRSNDGGRTFEPLLTQQGLGQTIGRVTLAIAPSDPDRLYALITNPATRGNPGGFAPGGSSLDGLYRSDDGGATWRTFFPENFMGQQGHYNSAVIVDPQNRDIVYVAGVTMLRSNDGGETFIDVTPNHVDVHDLTFDDAGRLLAADDGGVNRTSDGGGRWETLNEGLGIIQIYPGMSLHPTNPEVVLAGMQDNGSNLRTRDSREWLPVFGGDGGNTAIHPVDPDVMFVQFQGTTNFFRSLNAGLTFNESSTGIDPNDRNCFLPPFVIDPENPDRMLYATHRIYESRDRGATWTAISGDLTGGAPAAVRSLVIAPSNANVVYAMTNDGRVLVSSDAGREWTLIREGLSGWPRVTRQIAVDPLRPSQVYVGDMRFGGSRVLLSLDRGRTWREIGQRLPNVPVNTVAVHRAGQERVVFAGTDLGVFVTTNLGQTWQRYGTLPNAPVMDLLVDAPRGRLVASTLGRGAWEIALPE